MRLILRGGLGDGFPRISACLPFPGCEDKRPVTVASVQLAKGNSWNLWQAPKGVQETRRESQKGSELPLDFCDFFSGCGGTSRGMQEAGLSVRFGLDMDPDARDSFEANFPQAKFLCKDIRRLTSDDAVPYIERRTGRPLVFGACAPCQPFSNQIHDTAIDDGRRNLLTEFHRFVEAYLPEYIFVENVPGLQTIEKHKGPFSDFIALLGDLKYFYNYKIVMAYHYGVPQSRRRLVLLASNLGPICIPPPTHGPGTSNPSLPKAWDWISHLPAINAGETHAVVPNHRAAKLSPLNLRRIAATPVGGDRKAWPKALELNCHKKHSGHTDVYGRMIKHQPSAALTTRCISLSNGRFGHPTQNRAISVREAACIQTFPMDFIFQGSLNSMARQVGNAVPVLMAQVIGESVIRHYSQHTSTLAA